MRRIATLALCLAAAPCALAAGSTLDLSGVYGNETGCKVLGGADYAGDDKFQLHPDRYEAHESSCEFIDVLSSRAGAHVVKALCQGEGTYWVQSIIVSEPDPENDSLLVFFDNGELWHEVKPCS